MERISSRYDFCKLPTKSHQNVCDISAAANLMGDFNITVYQPMKRYNTSRYLSIDEYSNASVWVPGKGIIPFPTSNQQQQPKQISTVSVDYRHRRMAAGERRYLTPNQIKMKEKTNVFFCEFIHSECIQVFDDDDECK